MSWSSYFSCSSSHRSTLPLFPPYLHWLPRHIHFTVSCQEIVTLQQRNRHFRDAFIKDEVIWLIDIRGNVVDIRSLVLGLIQGDACRCLCNAPDVCGQEHPSSVWRSHKDRVRSTKNWASCISWCTEKGSGRIKRRKDRSGESERFRGLAKVCLFFLSSPCLTEGDISQNHSIIRIMEYQETFLLKFLLTSKRLYCLCVFM